MKSKPCDSQLHLLAKSVSIIRIEKLDLLVVLVKTKDEKLIKMVLLVRKADTNGASG